MRVTRHFSIQVEMPRRISPDNAALAHARLMKVMGSDKVSVVNSGTNTVFFFTVSQDKTDAEMRRVVQSATHGLT